jgi:hypothetical protein
MSRRLHLAQRYRSTALAIMAQLVGVIMLSGASVAQQVDADEQDAAKSLRQPICYQLSTFPNERYKLDIKFHSRLTEPMEERNFRHPKQFVFSIHGKHVGTCGGSTVRPVVGTLHSTVPTGKPLEARLGLESFNTTDVPNSCRDVEVSCKAGDAKGFPPPVLNCFGQNKFNDEFQFQLTRVDETRDERCSLFDDPSAANAAAADTSSSGTVRPK